MRLGAYECKLAEGSKTAAAYWSAPRALPASTPQSPSAPRGLPARPCGSIRERHRHRYEFNNEYKQLFEQAGMKCVGINPGTSLVEIVEIPALRWYIGTQFHPEYSSTVLHPHPLFMSFIRACLDKTAL
jgi:CTP synthase